MGMSLHFSYSQTKNVHTKINNLTQKIGKVNSNIQHLNSKSIDANNSLQRLSQECSTLRTNYQEQSNSISKLKLEQEMLELSFLALRQKLEDIHYATYNGSFIWRITNVAQKFGEQGKFINKKMFFLFLNFRRCSIKTTNFHLFSIILFITNWL
jgi:hypothetical protein